MFNPNVSYSYPGGFNMRESLFAETLRISPPEAKAFVVYAFSLFDEQVRLGQRSYYQVTPMELRNIAVNLCRSRGIPTVSNINAASTREVQHGSGSSSSSMTKAVYSVKRGRYDASIGKDDRQRFQLLARGDNTSQNDSCPFIGCSKSMERMYSRDTPTPSDIRPESVLVAALKYITGKAKKKEKLEGRRNAMKYLSEQLKGMRQDLRVQDIKNNFAVKVYEMHAKLSLECGDLEEFNQCQAALKILYLSPSVDRLLCSIGDFFCFRLLYLSLSQQFDSLSTELIHFTNSPKSCEKATVDEGVSHMVQLTLRLAAACDEGDIFTINDTLQKFQIEMRFLLFLFLQKRRVMWFQNLLTGVRGNISLKSALGALGFLPTTHHSSENKVFWLDLSQEQSEKQMHEFFGTLKLPLPTNFSLTRAMKPTDKTVFSLTAEEMHKEVVNYITYLGTRRDAVRASDGSDS